MSGFENLTPVHLLAQGFADHVVAWARDRNAPEQSLKFLHEAAMQTSLALSEGHVCVFVHQIVRDRAESDTRRLGALLVSSGVIGTPEEPGAMPLILDEDGRLYLHRYFDYERRLALRLMSALRQEQVVDPAMQARLGLLFPASQESMDARLDWQKIAAALAMQKNLAIISGKPGTGKTTTVVKLLACLLGQNPDCRIALAAPTGKAAARMLEAIRAAASRLPDQLTARLPTESFTVHRLLGVTPAEGEFRYHAGNPLAIDALVVDEASMLDIALATKLFEAVPATARIILLGDKDQLSAVEAGAVFADLSADPSLSGDCVAALSQLTGIAAASIRPAPSSQSTPMLDSVVWLAESFRFKDDSGVGRLAAFINAGDAAGACDLLRAESDGLDRAIEWIEDGGRVAAAPSMQRIQDSYAAYLRVVQNDGGCHAAVFEEFGKTRTLCAVREGVRGVEAMNRQIGKVFRAALYPDLDAGASSEWYPGRPVMVLRNDYVLKLFNGDIGIALPDSSGKLAVFFPDGAAGFRTVPIVRLPEHETAFAITVHKSQGSEFDQVILMLPAEPSGVVSRELLYTALTRSREKVTIIGNARVLEQAIQSPTRRRSGLIARMWGA
jgi:exodeoxyribonuclease V alpha subunit